jgi:hypothetical protein
MNRQAVTHEPRSDRDVAYSNSFENQSRSTSSGYVYGRLRALRQPAFHSLGHFRRDAESYVTALAFLCGIFIPQLQDTGLVPEQLTNLVCGKTPFLGKLGHGVVILG